MKRVFNFSAGPGVLPEAVLQKAAEEMLSHGESGMSVMEMSHRSKSYESIIKGAEETLRELMNIPANYKVLFLQGGASTQFAMIPLNLMPEGGSADYAITGMWAKKAAKEGENYGTVNRIASSEDKTFTYIPEIPAPTPNASYLHITTNNTIYGTRYATLPNTGKIPLVADMSSDILSRPYDVSKFGLIYAGAQKNMGPAGVTVVIVRENLIQNCPPQVPTMLKYSTHADSASMYNTPPTYAIYICKLVFEWVQSLGGVAAMEIVNEAKAKILYDFLDESALFRGTAQKASRSIMNVPFVLPTDELNAKFIKEAGENGFVNLKGHRSVGGMRASIYNAMPTEGVAALVKFMKQFEEANHNV